MGLFEDVKIWSEALDKMSYHGIKSIGDLAEVLVTDALHAKLVRRKGFDVISSKYGRIEVKCRKIADWASFNHHDEIIEDLGSSPDYILVTVGGRIETAGVQSYCHIGSLSWI